MKTILFYSILMMFISSCSSLDSVKKSPHCIVWKDQEYWGPYSVDVIAKKTEWKGACKTYNRDCVEVLISIDDSLNILSKTDVLGVVENNELRLSDKHALSEMINLKSVKVYPDLKLVKTSVGLDQESFQYNEKCTSEEAIAGAIAVDLISRLQTKK